MIGFKDYECIAAGQRKAASEHPDWRGLDQSEVDVAERNIAKRYVAAHLSRVPLVVAARLARVAGVLHPLGEMALDHTFYQQEHWVTYSLVGSFYLVAGLAIAGVIILHRRRTLLWPLVAIPLIVACSVAMTFGQIRYRAPAEPALVILAAVAVEGWICRGRVVSSTCSPLRQTLPE